LILARAPGRAGEYLGTTGTRMDAGDAIYAGFADTYVPRAGWPDLIARLEETGDAEIISSSAEPEPAAQLRATRAEIDAAFGGEDLRAILNALHYDNSEFNVNARRSMERNSPLAIACAVEMIHRLRGTGTDIRRALELEYRFTHRAMEKGDFLEGIRAAVIDKDRNPDWRHNLDDPPLLAVTQMLMPLGRQKLSFDKPEIAI
ncbi:MAG: enoyl-CoA hydratase/isomerase family protein, partial [Pseudomonadota bacterium]